MDKLQKVVYGLKDKYKFHTAILYGSRATQDFRVDSDYDLLCIRSSGERVREVFDQNGDSIDLIVDTEDLLDKPEQYMYLYSSKILLDEFGFGKKLILKNKELLEGPALKLPPNRVIQRKKNVLDTLKYLNNNSILSHYRRSDHLSKILPLYFALRGEWYLNDKHALNWLKDNDPGAYLLYEKALRPNASLKEIEKLSQYIINVD